MQLPKSESLFKKNLLIYFIVGYLLQANMIDDPIESLYEISAQVVLMLAFLAVLMTLNKTLYVYVQITTAFVFTANMLSILVIPLMVWLTVSEDALSYYLLFILLGWYFFIITYIMKHTLVINMAASMVLALFYFIVTYLGAFAFGQAV